MGPQQAASSAGAVSGAAVRSAAFAALAEQDVPVDTVFFHKCALLLRVRCTPTAIAHISSTLALPKINYL